MSYTRVTEARPYDAVYDPVYTGPYTNIQSDRRVAAAVSSQNVVAGTGRYKYFRRPIMPRLTAVPPNILLAPVAAQNPLAAAEEAPEPLTKNAEVQTMYRESEAQTLPYTPDYIVPEGTDPEVLLLKDLKYGQGLPLGKKEIEMIEQARLKRETESNMPPFTDEASLALRKRLMETQELREFKLRENEIDARREEKIAQLTQALADRDESNEFLASQRVEALRQTKMEEREKVLERIRNKRIKVLRRLARQRNTAEPILSQDETHDIITNYFDKASKVYAPIKREGQAANPDPATFDVATRVAPLDNLNNLRNLETSIHPVMLSSNSESRARMRIRDMMSSSAPTKLGEATDATKKIGKIPGLGDGAGKIAEPRLTSSTMRAIRQAKADVEEMHQILIRKKHATLGNSRGGADRTMSGGVGPGTAGTAPSAPQTGGSADDATARRKSTMLSSRKKGRPTTPDLTGDPTYGQQAYRQNTGSAGESIQQQQFREDFQAAVTLLQRLVRGRAVQNVMYEGRFRRRELIAELRRADEISCITKEKDAVEIANERAESRERKIRSSTVDLVTGTVATNILSVLQQEQVRIDMFDVLQAQANMAISTRRKAEAAEAGRRQRDNVYLDPNQEIREPDLPPDDHIFSVPPYDEGKEGGGVSDSREYAGDGEGGVGDADGGDGGGAGYGVVASETDQTEA